MNMHQDRSYLSHKTNVNKYKWIKIIRVCSLTITLEVNEKKSEISPTTW